MQTKCLFVTLALLFWTGSVYAIESLQSGSTGASISPSEWKATSGTSGTNTTGKPIAVMARYRGGYNAPYGRFVVRAAISVCGVLTSRGGSDTEGGWYTQYMSVMAIVPDGCAWNVSVYSNGYNRQYVVRYMELGQ